jgi:hypothetical protein
VHGAVLSDCCGWLLRRVELDVVPCDAVKERSGLEGVVAAVWICSLLFS